MIPLWCVMISWPEEWQFGILKSCADKTITIFKLVDLGFPVIAFTWNWNLHDILGTKIIVSKKNIHQNVDPNIYSNPCNSKLNKLCCTQLQSTNTFKSIFTHKTFTIYKTQLQKQTPNIPNGMHVNKQYTGKSEKAFNFKIKNHSKDVNKQNLLQADQHFQLPGHNFHKHAKFTLVKHLNNINIDKELLKYRLKKTRKLMD